MDFTDEQVMQVAAQTGATPDFIRQQLIAEGNNVGGPAPGLNLGTMQATTLPPELPPSTAPINLGTMQAAPVGAIPAEAAAPGAAPGQWSVNAQNLSLPPELAQPGAGPGAQVRRPGIRATGAGLPQQLTQGAAGGGGDGGMSRVRKLFDSREKALNDEYSQIAPAVQAGQQRLDELSNQAFGFHQDRLNAEAQRAQRAAQMYDELDQQTAAAQQADQVAREKENGVLQAKGQELDQKREDYANTRIRDQPTSSRVASAFALAFAGIADALNSSVGNKSNFQASTMQIVNDAIDRDVDEQLRQIQVKKGAADDTERALLQLRQTTQDERAFRAATRSSYYDQFNARLTKLAAQTTSETAKTAAAEGQTLFQQASEAAKQEARVGHINDAQARLRSLDDKRLGVEATAAIKAAGAGGKKEDKPTPGATGLLQLRPDVTAADRAKAQEIASGVAGIVQNIGSLKEMAKKGATLSPDQRAIARRRLGALKSQFNGVFGDGTAPNEAQLEALDDMFANPTEMNIGSAEKQFEVFERDAIDQTNAKLRPYSHALDDGGDFEPE